VVRKQRVVHQRDRPELVDGLDDLATFFVRGDQFLLSSTLFKNSYQPCVHDYEEGETNQGLAQRARCHVV
jgi:hypothetical protein